MRASSSTSRTLSRARERGQRSDSLLFMSRALLASVLAAVALVTVEPLAAPGFSKLAPGLARVPRHPSVRGDIHINFVPKRALPAGGYYYAVLVLEGYKRASEADPPSCAISSNVKLVEYGYPDRNGRVHLALPQAKSPSKRWCPGGTYTGAIYAVPHRPPCTSTYRCHGGAAETEGLYASNPCWEMGGHAVCGEPAPSESERERWAKEKIEREQKKESNGKPRKKPNRKKRVRPNANS